MVLELDQNEVTDLFHRPDGYYLVQVKHVTPAFVPEFEVIKKEVKAEYLRRGRDEALEKMLAMLWVRANIDVNQSLIDPSLLSDKAEFLLSAAINE
jgi:parvulin-like peptidyl-prolyl isomerase